MKNIGIALFYAPEQTLTNHGIGRLLGYTMKGLIESHCRITLVIPSWYKAWIDEFLQDQNIDPAIIELVVIGKTPFILRLRAWLWKQKNRQWKKKFNTLSFKIKRRLNRYFHYVLSRSLKGFLTPHFMLFFLLSLVQIPFYIFFYGLLLTIKISFKILNIFNVQQKNIRQKMNGHLVAFFNKSRRLMYALINRFPFLHYCKFPFVLYLAIFRRPLKAFNENLLAIELFRILRKKIMRAMITEIDTRSYITTWFLPALVWPELTTIKAKTIVAAPDVVLLDFPALFNKKKWSHIYNQVKKTIAGADHFICYSQHVKEKQLAEHFNIEKANISVIEHGFNNLATDFRFKNLSEKNMPGKAKKILQLYQKTHFTQNAYLKDFHFDDIRYIFYSSQIRPHKNVMNLLKAYEIILRKKFKNIKLLLTADFTFHSEIKQFIESRRLQRDVIAFPDVSSQMLATLNHLAICSVNPTLFEGGFPFTFAEAYSVGTPSVISAIPVVNEMIQDETLKEKMLFDPYHVSDMVDKIIWGIDHREELLELQKPLYEKLSQRTWDHVAKEYIEVFERVTNAS